METSSAKSSLFYKFHADGMDEKVNARPLSSFLRLPYLTSFQCVPVLFDQCPERLRWQGPLILLLWISRIVMRTSFGLSGQLTSYFTLWDGYTLERVKESTDPLPTCTVSPG